MSFSLKSYFDQFKQSFRDRPRFYFLLIAIVFALIGFEEVADDVFSDPSEGDYEARVLDDAARDFVRAYRTETLTRIMTDLTSLGSFSVMTTLFLVLASVIVFYRDFIGLLYLAVIFGGSAIWPFVLKNHFGRGRPDVGEHLVNVLDLSFPSGHSFGAAAIYFGLCFYVARFAKNLAQEFVFYFIAAFLILLVGVSRIYLGVHFATDVLGGICSGAAWGLFVSALYEVYLHRRSKGATLAR